MLTSTSSQQFERPKSELLNTVSNDLLPKLRQKALQCLSSREYGLRELEQKLNDYAHQLLKNTSKEHMQELNRLDDLHEFIHTLVAQIVCRLQTQNLLNEERFIQSQIYQKQSKYSTRYIAQSLKQKGVAQNENLCTALATLKETDYARAQAIWQKKFNHFPQNSKEWAKQARFLSARGFDPSIIGKVLKQNTPE